MELSAELTGVHGCIVAPQAALKKYQTEQRSKGDALDKCQAELKKLRKKSQGSKNPQKYSDKELQVGWWLPAAAVPLFWQGRAFPSAHELAGCLSREGEAPRCGKAGLDFWSDSLSP